MPAEVKIQVGEYRIDDTSWMDVRLTDMGPVISVCDNDMNVRYTVMVDQGKTVYAEVAELISEEAQRKMLDLPPDAPEPEKE